MPKTAIIMVYSSFIIIFGFFISLLTILFIGFIEGYNFEMFSTAPGLYAIEWLFSLWMIPAMAIIIALISGYLATFLYFNLYIKRLSNKSKIGIAQTENLSPAMTWLKILTRSLILALFTMNIAYMLSSQTIVVDAVRTDLPISSILLPDTLTMYGLLYLVIIPCSFILVPIWISNDSGLVRTKKIRKKDIDSVKLVSTPLYKLVKGYVGIGFIFNLIVLTIDMFLRTAVDPITAPLLIMAPLIIVFFVSPMVILIEICQKSFKFRMLRILEKLGLNKSIEVTVNLKPIRDPI